MNEDQRKRIGDLWKAAQDLANEARSSMLGLAGLEPLEKCLRATLHDRYPVMTDLVREVDRLKKVVHDQEDFLCRLRTAFRDVLT